MIAKSMMVLALVGCISSNVYAQDEKEETIRKLLNALEYPRQFKSQMEQGNNHLKAQAQLIFQKMQADSGGKLNAKAEEAFNKYASKDPMLYSDELLSTWISVFGKDLSQDELNTILAFLQSPVGRKFVLVSEKANNEFATWFLEDQQVKSERSLNEFIKELRETMK